MLRALPELGEELTRWATSDHHRVATGFGFFDTRTGGGVATGELLILIARSGVGKTWWALNVMANNPDTPTLFFSIEMAGRLILSRLAAIHTGVPTRDLEDRLSRHLDVPEIRKTQEAYPFLYVDDTAEQTLGGMIDTIESYEATVGRAPQLVVVDYVGLIRTFGDSELESTTSVVKGLKVLARDQDVALMALHQVSRGSSYRPRGQERSWNNEGHLALTPSDAQYGGEVQADYLMGMYRPALDPGMPQLIAAERANEVRLQFLKSRAGHEIHPLGKQHHLDVVNGRIRDLVF